MTIIALDHTVSWFFFPKITSNNHQIVEYIPRYILRARRTYELVGQQSWVIERKQRKIVISLIFEAFKYSFVIAELNILAAIFVDLYSFHSFAHCNQIVLVLRGFCAKNKRWSELCCVSILQCSGFENSCIYTPERGEKGKNCIARNFAMISDFEFLQIRQHLIIEIPN